MSQTLEILGLQNTQKLNNCFFRIDYDKFNLYYTVPQLEVVSMSISCFKVLIYLYFLILQAKMGIFDILRGLLIISSIENR